MDDEYKFKRRIYDDAHGIDLLICPSSTSEVEEFEMCIIQTEDTCNAKFTVEPLPYSKSKITIYVYAEGTSEVNCVCTLNIPRDVEGVETDIQIRSWPFDRSKIQARPEMFIANSNVVATHGNAIGTISNADKYYLASRGIVDYKELIKQSLLDYA
jgi:hypothetical protein